MTDDRNGALREILITELAEWSSKKLESGIGITMILSAMSYFVSMSIETLRKYWDKQEGGNYGA